MTANAVGVADKCFDPGIQIEIKRPREQPAASRTNLQLWMVDPVSKGSKSMPAQRQQFPGRLFPRAKVGGTKFADKLPGAIGIRRIGPTRRRHQCEREQEDSAHGVLPSDETFTGPMNCIRFVDECEEAAYAGNPELDLPMNDAVAVGEALVSRYETLSETTMVGMKSRWTT